jgi:RimJ/RimL family protein N-acetyltransferase
VLKAAAIATPRLWLMPVTVADLDEMVAILSHPSLYEFTGGGAPDIEELRRRYERWQAGQSPDGREAWLNWTVRLQGSAIGSMQAGISGGVAELAWLVGLPWQGQGYASEAAAALVAWLARQGVRETIAKINAAHHASMGVARNAGLSPTSRTVDGEAVWSTGFLDTPEGRSTR